MTLVERRLVAQWIGFDHRLNPGTIVLLNHVSPHIRITLLNAIASRSVALRSVFQRRAYLQYVVM